MVKKDSIASKPEVRDSSLYNDNNQRSLSSANKMHKLTYTPTAKNTHPAMGIYDSGQGRRSKLKN